MSRAYRETCGCVVKDGRMVSECHTHHRERMEVSARWRTDYEAGRAQREAEATGVRRTR